MTLTHCNEAIELLMVELTEGPNERRPHILLVIKHLEAHKKELQGDSYRETRNTCPHCLKIEISS